ncbi:hypothetical protein EDB19DRAFT_1827586 [Suillus lakei]|nr:hypothetical protein EDB19DRAFT_1827586 [Suillus lakei]
MGAKFLPLAHSCNLVHWSSTTYVGCASPTCRVVLRLCLPMFTAWTCSVVLLNEHGVQNPCAKLDTVNKPSRPNPLCLNNRPLPLGDNGHVAPGDRELFEPPSPHDNKLLAAAQNELPSHSLGHLFPHLPHHIYASVQSALLCRRLLRLKAELKTTYLALGQGRQATHGFPKQRQIIVVEVLWTWWVFQEGVFISHTKPDGDLLRGNRIPILAKALIFSCEAVAYGVIFIWYNIDVRCICNLVFLLFIILLQASWCAEESHWVNSPGSAALLGMQNLETDMDWYTWGTVEPIAAMAVEISHLVASDLRQLNGRTTAVDFGHHTSCNSRSSNKVMIRESNAKDEMQEDFWEAEFVLSQTNQDCKPVTNNCFGTFRELAIKSSFQGNLAGCNLDDTIHSPPVLWASFANGHNVWFPIHSATWNFKQSSLHGPFMSHQRLHAVTDKGDWEAGTNLGEGERLKAGFYLAQTGWILSLCCQVKVDTIGRAEKGSRFGQLAVKGAGCLQMGQGGSQMLLALVVGRKLEASADPPQSLWSAKEHILHMRIISVTCSI